MKPNDIVMVPMEESPSMLGAWARLKHLGKVRITTNMLGHRELYRTSLEYLDGRCITDENEDLYRTFLNIYRRILREKNINQARENRLKKSTSNHLIYDEVEKVWRQSNDIGNCQNLW